MVSTPKNAKQNDGGFDTSYGRVRTRLGMKRWKILDLIAKVVNIVDAAKCVEDAILAQQSDETEFVTGQHGPTGWLAHKLRKNGVQDAHDSVKATFAAGATHDPSVGLPFAVTGTLSKLDTTDRVDVIEACPEVKLIFPSLSEPGCFGAKSTLDKTTQHLDDADKQRVTDEVADALKWLEDNADADANAGKARRLDFDNVVHPVIQDLYAKAEQNKPQTEQNDNPDDGLNDDKFFDGDK